MIVNYNEDVGWPPIFDNNVKRNTKISGNDIKLLNRLEKVATPESLASGLVDIDNFIKKMERLLIL